MERVALPPFRSVTRGPSSILSPVGNPASTDGMMSSHMRFTAFQGNSPGRATPLSMTPELAMLLTQPDFASWREGGGLMMSNALGAPAIRRYFGPAQPGLPYRQISLDAFTAGNDLLYLSQFADDDDWESELQNIKATIGFFQERYVADPSFAAQVDAALRRILRLKLRLYAQESGSGSGQEEALSIGPALRQVAVESADLEPLVGESRQAAFTLMGEVARRSITLLYPDANNLVDAIPPAPRSDDQLLIFTDSRLLRECDGCIAEAAVGPDELANIILRLYGPDATDQIEADQIVSLTFADLAEVLDQESAEMAEPVEPSGGEAAASLANPAPVPRGRRAEPALRLRRSSWTSRPGSMV
ncbi:MAG: hypothetical protein HC802_02050 [Caldilineaceae bacterium]|nr:hypothetical protein [Caldilineaceae bacterium]